jgi:hypothetical protein
MIYIEMMSACNLDGMLNGPPMSGKQARRKRSLTILACYDLNALNGLNGLNF